MLDQKRVINWRNLVFFGGTTAIALVGIPIYISIHGLSRMELGLFLFWAFVTGISITVGYHRLFAHRAFEVNPVIEFLVTFFGAGAFQESVLQWTAQHRQHHRFVDTDQDPYNIKQGFFYAHLGWLLVRKHAISYEFVRDLKVKKVLVHQHRHYVLWAIGSGIILPTVVGALLGHGLGAFLIAVAGRLTFVHHGTFMINSVCHYFGRPTYDRQSSPKDHWIVALITNGEGYHSFHHRFPSDYRNGVKWYHWDPSKWAIRLMSFAGLAKNLKRASDFQILSAHLTAEKELVEHSVVRMPDKVQSAALEALKVRYNQVKDLLHLWELRVKEHAAICSQGFKKSNVVRKTARVRIQEAKRQFLAVKEQWASFVARPATFQFAFNN